MKPEPNDVLHGIDDNLIVHFLLDFLFDHLL